MQGWWRVLGGVWPYRWRVTISMICAIGVGASYASGVAVLLPVLKIFVSNEGVHGWANRTAAQERLSVEILDLDSTVERTQRNADGGPLGLIVTKVYDNAPDILRPIASFDAQIIRVTATVRGKPVESSKWFGTKDKLGMVDILAGADPAPPPCWMWKAGTA